MITAEKVVFSPEELARMEIQNFVNVSTFYLNGHSLVRANKV